MNKIKKIIQESIEVKQLCLSSEELIATVKKVSEALTDALGKGNKVLFCGNGGSAADAQHLAAELSGRFYFHRPSLPAEALHVNTSYITAVANDYSYDDIYSRYIEGAGKKGDVLIALSTSGNSKNIVNAIKAAREIGMITVGMTGKSGGIMKELVDFLINIPSECTPRIQETHITIGHIICEFVEQELFGKK